MGGTPEGDRHPGPAHLTFARALGWLGGGTVAAAVLFTSGILVAGRWSLHPTAAVPSQAARPHDAPPPRTATKRPPFLELHVHPATRRELEPAIAVLRRHHQLADQRVQELRRLHHNQLAHLQISDVCDDFGGCQSDVLGTGAFVKETRSCHIDLYMSEVRREAREWQVPVRLMLTMVLVHEQEHCLVAPDDRERPAVEAEVRLARQLHDPTLIEFAEALQAQLTSKGYWPGQR
jgi:hypothetical protein